MSERRACKVLDQPRSTQRRVKQVPSDEPRLIRRMVQLASDYGRYGYRVAEHEVGDTCRIGLKGHHHQVEHEPHVLRILARDACRRCTELVAGVGILVGRLPVVGRKRDSLLECPNRFEVFVESMPVGLTNSRLQTSRIVAHQGLGNVLLAKSDEKPPDESSRVEKTATLPLDLSEIRCETRLGGLLRHYYREAA